MSETKAEDYQWVSIEEVTKPLGGTVDVYIDYWWVTNGKGEVAVYRRFYPQCNADRRITDRLARAPGATGSVQIPLAFWRGRYDG